MSSIHPITLPKWGLEMSEGTIAAWHVAEGTDAEKGVDFVDIETEKIVNTLDLERGGKVRRLLAKPGDVLPVGALIAVLAPASVTDAEVDRFVASYKPINASFDPDSAQAEKSQAPAPAPAAEPAAPAKAATSSSLSADELRARNDAAHATPIARRIANQRGIDLSTITGTGRSGRISQEDVEKAFGPAGGEKPEDVRPESAPAEAAALSPAELKAANEGVHASPIARKVANSLGVKLSGLTGTGRKGRVSLGDVERAAEALGLVKPTVTETVPQQPAPSAARSAEASTSPAAADGVVPFTALRRSIAQTLVRAKQTVPHFYTTIDIDADALLDLRRQVNANQTTGGKASINDFILRAVALALRKHPDVNVHVIEDGIRTFAHADIAVAVAIDGGLVTPVIRNVGAKSVTEIAGSAAALAEKARARTLGADDLKGATFTVSNLGMFGVRAFDAIINPPQAAILAVGGVRREAREKDGGIGFVSVMSVTLSADHRAIDGALAARYLAALRELVENPLSLMM